jgi:hypothetical protein
MTTGQGVRALPQVIGIEHDSMSDVTRVRQGDYVLGAGHCRPVGCKSIKSRIRGHPWWEHRLKNVRRLSLGQMRAKSARQ